LEEWLLPAFGIPIRNPAVANNPSGLESRQPEKILSGCIKFEREI
jgi:hypothetical protein